MASKPLEIDDETVVPLDPEPEPVVVPAAELRGRLIALARNTGNIAEAMSAELLTRLGQDVVSDYEKDDETRKEWKDVAEKMLDLASQDGEAEPKDFPWPSASRVNVPLLTVAALQFNARMYPSAIKGDEAILCKVIGNDNGTPQRAPNGAIMPVIDQATGQLVPGPDGGPQIAWLVPPGGKARRAKRVSEYLNTTVFYRMDGWEADTDALLMQMPIVGCVFRQVWWDRGPQSAMVPALDLVVPMNVRSLASSPRITKVVRDIYPHEIDVKQRAGVYLDVDLRITEDDEPRTLLEQHCWLDLDEDGHAEPYIVTVDKDARQVLRVESNFAERDIVWASDAPDALAVSIRPGKFFIKYGIFPHPKGLFYDLGLGHLLNKVGAAVDTALNQLIDAGTARIAGGGFIGSGLRLQSRAGRSVVKFQPGEFKTVDIAGDDIRKAIVDRPVPEVSPVTFQVLDFILGFAKEIAGTKDVLTGEAAATAPVGTTLALIEQGLQVFNAVAKRFFRSAREEYQLIFDNLARFGNAETARDYAKVLDDPEADFATDFADADMDIRPVSDPSAVTRMQKMAKAEYIKSTIGMLASVGGDVREAMRRQYEAADIEDIEKLMPPQQPQQPDPMQIAQLNKLVAGANKDAAQAAKLNADAVLTAVRASTEKYDAEKTAIKDGIATKANEQRVEDQ